MKTTLFVAGFESSTRARDLAYEFERYGRLVRCDIPAPKSASSKPYAFVEFEDARDAEDAFNEMHGRRIDGRTISVQWARNAPSARWRFDPPNRRLHSQSPPPPPPARYNSRRSRSPYYRRSLSPRGRSPPPPPPLYRYRSRSPVRRGEYGPDDIPPPPPHYLQHHNSNASRSPPPYSSSMPRQSSRSP
ncbi:hypothetical protein O0I10_011150 [Lichtheimia ornata]|uniref:RRM domain-containing protein n=1 Tax=Lichtheimia ornata TaxID=688661 RepID=A0AAD7UU60_9FUNG|nr:uncharacterized protein O0I10_011150 [Lichtheimia ornata]KAJ8653203.1 hypothetical protein O0I10_011150 [Lichtheimia ornata]